MTANGRLQQALHLHKSCGNAITTSLAAFTVLILLAAPVGAWAEPDLPERITVCCPSEDYRPFHYLHEGEPTGVLVETVALVCAELGVEAEFRLIPWVRGLDMMRQGEIDAMLSLYRTPEREEYMLYPRVPLAMDATNLFTRKDAHIRWTGDLRDVEGITVNVVQENSYGAEFDNAEYIVRWPSRNEEQMVRMVLGGRHRLGIGGRAVVRHWAEVIGQADLLRILSPPVAVEPIYAAFSRAANLEAFVEAFSRKLKPFKKTDRYRAILGRHGL